MSIESNVRVRQLCNTLMDLGCDLCKENKLNAEQVKRFWGHVIDSAGILIGASNKYDSEQQPADAYHNRTRRLIDSDRLAWPNSVHYRKRLGDIPDDYWLWFLRQPWCDEWPALVEYANVVVEE